MAERGRQRRRNGSASLGSAVHIDGILRNWSYDPEGVAVRVARGDDDREVIQMRVDLGLLQLETVGRPDGERPGGLPSYLDLLRRKSDREERREGDAFVMDDDECAESDREFVQFYHRRICWLQLNRFEQAIQDADHTLELMDFCREHSPDEQWTLSHEQYRPFVLFQRTQAAAMACLERGGEEGAEAAIAEVNDGLEAIGDFFDDFDVAEQYEENDFVQRLLALREELREEYQVGVTLKEKLSRAVEEENYELAAEIRDEIARRELSA